MMKRKLVAYFSATGTTAAVAKNLAQGVGGDLYEIQAKQPYVPADLDWHNEKARSTLEMKDPASRPGVVHQPLNVAEYDTVYLGFPIWWYVAPTIVNTFLEAHDWAGKTIVLFATSGGSGLGETCGHLASSCPGATLVEGGVVEPNATVDQLKAWAEGL